jgi:dsRNA-specific ribonuclease
LAQQQRWMPTWSEFTCVGPPHAPRFEVTVTVDRGAAEIIKAVGEGKTKSAAQHAAAAQALQKALPKDQLAKLRANPGDVHKHQGMAESLLIK